VKNEFKCRHYLAQSLLQFTAASEEVPLRGEGRVEGEANRRRMLCNLVLGHVCVCLLMVDEG
jgi:hypothetical protein